MNMNYKKGIALALTVSMLGNGVLALAQGKEEVVYGVLDAQGQVDGLYAVNIFDGGDIVDYGDYASVHPLNTEDEISYADGEVRFHSDAQRVYYQGNLNTRDLPWLFHLSYRLDGQAVTAEELAGKSGHVEIELDIRRNPDYQGELFRSHALQITGLLDMEKCRNITAEGATQANVGTSRQLSYIVLPNTEKTILISADATDFEMDAISINGVQLSLDINVDDSELSEQTDKIVDAGAELDDGAQELLDGATELAEHNAELLDGAQQIVDAIFDAANDTLQASEADFTELGIRLHTLTTENYAQEISRLQSELLEKVDDYVRDRADQQLREMVEAAARKQVVSAVEAAARQQVTEEVTNAAREQVRQQVMAGGEAQVRAAVEAATRQQVEQQVRAQAKAQARQQIESEIRNPSEETVNAQVEQQMKSDEVQAEIRAAVRAELEQASATATPAPTATEAPTVTPEPTVTPAPETNETPIGDAAAESTGVSQPEAERGEIAWQEIFELNAAQAEDQFTDEQVNAIVSACMASPEVQAQIDAQTDAIMASASTQAAIDAETAQRMQSAEVQAVIDSQTQQKINDPAIRAQAEDAVRQEIRPQVEAAARQKTRDAILNLSDEEVQALVEQQLQSGAVQAQIESAVAEQMASQQLQDRIAAEIEAQMNSEAVQQQIDAEVEAQLALGDTQALLESMIEQQMQSDVVQQLIGQNVEAQMASSEVRSLIDQNIEAQMASDEVRSRIEQEIEKQRQSREYLDSVAEALEENGENGEAYRALSELREKLDDVQKFYDGLQDYTDGVNELLDGTQEMKDGTGEFRDETADINDTINEKIDNMIAEKTGSNIQPSSFVDPRNTNVENVQFVITTPAIRISSAQEEAPAEVEDSGILQRIRDLFK